MLPNLTVWKRIYFFLVIYRNAILSWIRQITLCYRDFTREITKRSLYRCVRFLFNFHGRTCVHEICVLYEFELLTDDMEHSEAIKTNTTMCIWTQEETIIQFMIDHSWIPTHHSVTASQAKCELQTLKEMPWSLPSRIYKGCRTVLTSNIRHNHSFASQY